jgi:hypothetical protein
LSCTRVFVSHRSTERACRRMHAGRARPSFRPKGWYLAASEGDTASAPTTRKCPFPLSRLPSLLSMTPQASERFRDHASRPVYSLPPFDDPDESYRTNRALHAPARTTGRQTPSRHQPPDGWQPFGGQAFHQLLPPLRAPRARPNLLDLTVASKWPCGRQCSLRCRNS